MVTKKEKDAIEKASWETYGEPPTGPELVVDEPDTIPEPGPTRLKIEDWFASGWPTADRGDWHNGGYVDKERASAAIRVLADEIDALRARLNG